MEDSTPSSSAIIGTPTTTTVLSIDGSESGGQEQQQQLQSTFVTTGGDGTAVFAYTNDAPPGLKEMFINSTDTLRHRTLNQRIPKEWNDKPPLFEVKASSQKSTTMQQLRPFTNLWNRRQQQGDTNQNNNNNNARLAEKEDPNLLKGVSCVVVLLSLVFSGGVDLSR
jgi:hypothetical protein